MPIFVLLKIQVLSVQKTDKCLVDQKLENAKRKLHQGYQQAENGEHFSCYFASSNLCFSFLRNSFSKFLFLCHAFQLYGFFLLVWFLTWMSVGNVSKKATCCASPRYSRPPEDRGASRAGQTQSTHCTKVNWRTLDSK